MFRSSLIILSLLIMISPASAQPSDEVDLKTLAQAINLTMRENHYDPSELETEGYLRTEENILKLADTATSEEEFLIGFTEIWRDGPFSHVVLQKARQSAEDTAAYLDQLRIGGGGATLSWNENIALLTVKTMMGLDTIEEIEAAYDVILEKNAEALIIDLRNNPGGAFAIIPLVQHIIEDPLDAGGFIGQRWNSEMDRAPTLADALAVEPWQGWSVSSFWADVQANTLIRIRFEPEAEGFKGPVYVLLNHQTASAAELAADALQASGRAILIGEVSAGEMLSQKMYDLPGGYHLYLPIADYYSFHGGRIEGQGVTPDILADPDEAMTIALEHARK